jgi:hypothetical protein
MPKGTYWANQVCNELNGKSLFIALSSTVISASGDGITEPSVGAGYSRYAIPLNAWGTAAGGSVANLNPFTFNPATALWLSGNPVIYFALLDSGNNLYYFNQIPPAFQRVWGGGDVPSFSSGVLVIQEN